MTAGPGGTATGRTPVPFTTKRPAIPNRLSLRRRALFAGAAALPLLGALPAAADDDLMKIGLLAALSSQTAKPGEAITRGIELALDVINAGGGMPGRTLELVSRDDESNPGTGFVAARELVQREEMAALIGGLDTPVSMTIVPFTPDDQDALGPQDGFVAPRG